MKNGPIPESVGMNSAKLAEIDTAVQEAIAVHQCPGAVVLVSRFKQIVWYRAYGNRRVKPHREPMTCDTIFDIASMTKALATAPAIMLLIEQKKITLNDRISTYFPLFACHGKQEITIEHLLRHRSGLTGNNPNADYEQGYKIALENIFLRPIPVKPDTEFCYSDSGYIVLAELFQTHNQCITRYICPYPYFAPLGMHDTERLTHRHHYIIALHQTQKEMILTYAALSTIRLPI